MNYFSYYRNEPGRVFESSQEKKKQLPHFYLLTKSDWVSAYKTALPNMLVKEIDILF